MRSQVEQSLKSRSDNGEKIEKQIVNVEQKQRTDGSQKLDLRPLSGHIGKPKYQREAHSRSRTQQLEDRMSEARHSTSENQTL